MNLERGFRRLMIVVSGLIVALGMVLMVIAARSQGGAPGTIAVVVGMVIAVFWAAFFTLRWVARGFLDTPARTERRPSSPSPPITSTPVAGTDDVPRAVPETEWTRVVPETEWTFPLGGKAVALLVVGMIGLLLWASWDFVRLLLREPSVAWHTIVADFLASAMVVWLRQAVGDRAAAWIGLGFATMVALGLVFEVSDWWSLRRQAQALRRLEEHQAACQACQQLADANPYDFSEDEYCPVGKRLNRKYMRS